MSDLTLGKKVNGHEPFEIKSDSLVTHGVIVGMTGSGKTGLGVTAIEEAVLAGVPVVVVDPKGDLCNLALCLRNASDAVQFNSDSNCYENTRKERKEWGIADEDVDRYVASRSVTIYTPGSRSGVPVNIISALESPNGDANDDEALTERIETTANAVLAFAGISPDENDVNTYMQAIIAHAWKNNEKLTLEKLVAFATKPPKGLVKIGTLSVDEHISAQKRQNLSRAINCVIASSTSALWKEGAALDIDNFLYEADGRPKISVFYTSHLDDDKRSFFTTLLLTRIVAWMRRQRASQSLKLLVYIDEVNGICPPTACPPTKKPLMTLFKQGRAFGVGVIVATQNVTDIDYKVLSNAGTWLIGRLLTEQDRCRVVNGLELDNSPAGKNIESMLSNLGKREFVAYQPGKEPCVFHVRQSYSWLIGPMTKQDIEALVGKKSVATKPKTSPRRERAIVAARKVYADRLVIAAHVCDSGRSVKLTPMGMHSYKFFFERKNEIVASTRAIKAYKLACARLECETECSERV